MIHSITIRQQRAHDLATIKYEPSVISVERRGDPKRTVRDELAATRIRPMDAPMATRDADDSEGEEEVWGGPTSDYQEIKAKIPWELIGLVVWSWFVFLIGRASA